MDKLQMTWLYLPTFSSTRQTNVAMGLSKPNKKMEDIIRRTPQIQSIPDVQMETHVKFFGMTVN
jgi:hypothetical protein